jgi:hypothetical protein
VDKGSDEPGGMAAKRRMGEAEEAIRPATDIDAILEDVPEALIDVIVGDLRVELKVSSIFVAKLYTNKIFGVFREAAQDAILRLRFRAMKSHASRCNADFMDHREV